MATAITADHNEPVAPVRPEGMSEDDKRDQLKEAAERIYALEQERSEITEQIRQVKHELVKPLMDLGDFTPAYGLYRRQRNNDDGAEQVQKSISAWRLAFSALEPGGQADLFKLH